MQSTGALHTYLEVPVVGVSDGAAGFATHEMFRGDTSPPKLCVQDDSSSGAVGSGWILSGRVLP